MAAKSEVIGYMVSTVDEDLSIEDVLYNRRILYNTWENAIDACKVKLEEVYELHGRDICVKEELNQKSKSDCVKMKYCTAYNIKEKRNRFELANILIFPVFQSV